MVLEPHIFCGFGSHFFLTAPTPTPGFFQAAPAPRSQKHPAPQPCIFGFKISSTIAGYQMLKKGGWDGMTGLGESGKGRLFPVKSVLKTDRSGVKEGANKSAKITHFAANDKESVNNRIRVQRKIKPSNEENVNNEIFLRGALGDF